MAREDIELLTKYFHQHITLWKNITVEKQMLHLLLAKSTMTGIYPCPSAYPVFPNIASEMPWPFWKRTTKCSTYPQVQTFSRNGIDWERLKRPWVTWPDQQNKAKTTNTGRLRCIKMTGGYSRLIISHRTHCIITTKKIWIGKLNTAVHISAFIF